MDKAAWMSGLFSPKQGPPLREQWGPGRYIFTP